MKVKSFLLIALLSLLLVDCSKNETSPTICYLSSYSGSYTGSYTYTNNKLTASTESGTNATYTSDTKGNIITINYAGGGVENYEYNSNNVKTLITSPNQYQFKYTYNSCGQLTKREYYIYSSGNYILYNYLVFQYASSAIKNWNILQLFDAADNLTSTTTFQYDSKSNPWAVVWGTSSIETANNPTQQIYTLNGGASVTTTISYTYNSNGYPLTSITTVGSNSPTNATYVYTNCQ